MISLMTDIETLSLSNDAAVLSIGVALFNEDEVLKTDGWSIDLAKIHGDINPGTLKWWMDQDPTAREFSIGGKLSNGTAAYNFKTFIAENNPTEFWANDPDFDYIILKNWWKRINDQRNDIYEAMVPGDWPIKYWAYRSCRTIAAEADRLGFDSKAAKEKYLAHNPIEDAAAQARMVIAARQFIGSPHMRYSR